MKFGHIAVFAGAALLTACTQGAPITTPPVEVNIKHSSTSARVVGFTEPVVRTYISENEDSTDAEPVNTQGETQQGPPLDRKEVVGAACKLDSAEFSASFTTPAIIRAPKFKGKPTPIRLVCTTGERKSDFTFRPRLDGVVVSGPSVAGLVTAAVTAGIAASRDIWSYGTNDIAVWVPLGEKK